MAQDSIKRFNKSDERVRFAFAVILVLENFEDSVGSWMTTEVQTHSYDTHASHTQA